jgi:glycosyltransferase involved in cell wall biosynthesis
MKLIMSFIVASCSFGFELGWDMLTGMNCPWTSLSIFFPVLNEAGALPGLLDRAIEVLDGYRLDSYEIIVVDDGSTDGTPQLADRYAHLHKQVRVVHHPTNLGYGAALQSGFKAAQYEWVGFTDGDGQFDLANLERFFDPSTRVDVVLGYRRKRHDHFGRKLNAWLWGKLVATLLNLHVRDLDCGFKLIKTQKLRQLGPLEAHGAVISAELLLKLRNEGCRWEEVAVEHYPRRGGAASGARLSVIARAVGELVRLRSKVASAK